jgi:ribosomal protein L3 glutamine methyltransferase
MLPEIQILKQLSRIKDWVRYAMSEFQKAHCYYGHGTDNALDEAVYLILHTLNLPLDLPSHLFDCKLTLQERKEINDILQQRILTRKPAAYLTHESYFMGLPFYVDERVLIPRSPLAELIEKAFYPFIEENKVEHILDLCTGSGCIAIACAQIFPDANIIASDISTEALSVAKINVDKYHLENQIQSIKSDLFSHIPENSFDVIISNPPYVDKEDMGNLPKEFQYEPKMALEAGVDGLTVIRKILKNAKKYLSPHGILIVETGNSKEALIAEFPEVPFHWLDFEKSESEVFLIKQGELSFS